MRKTLLDATLTLALAVGCAKLPQTAFSATPLTGAPPLTVVFSDSSSNEPTSWLWRFGDGDTSTVQNPTHVYDSTGTYDVTLVVTNSAGTDSLTKPDYIEVGQLGYEKIEISGITLQWRSDSANLYVKLSAPTTGWAAVAFNSAPTMVGSNFILGYVKGNVVVITDQYGNQPHNHVLDTDLGGSDNITDKHGTESAGSTQITFTIPLDSGDSNDIVLVKGQTYSVLLSYASDGIDDLTVKHVNKFATTIKI